MATRNRKPHSPKVRAPKGRDRATPSGSPAEEFFQVLNEKMLPGLGAVRVILQHLYDRHTEGDNARLANILKLGYDALDESYERLDVLQLHAMKVAS